MKKDELTTSIVIRAGQRPALMLYVPLSLFIAEAMVGLTLFRLIGYWVITLLPIHFYFITRTAEDYHWMSTVKADIYHYLFFVKNKGLHGKGVITFTASPPNARERNYDGLR